MTGRGVAQDEGVAAQRTDGPFEDQLHPTAFARGDGHAVEHGHPSGHMRRAQMHMNRRPVGHGLCRQCPQAHVDAERGRWHIAGHDPVARGDPFPMQVRADQVQGAAFSRTALRRRCVLRMDGAHPCLAAVLQEPDRITDRDAAADYSARHDQAGTSQVEAAIDRQSEIPAGAATRQLAGLLVEVTGDIVHTGTAQRRARENRHAGKCRLRHQIPRLADHFAHAHRRHPIDLGQGDRAAAHA
ncbi:MAG: hypothetical protein ABIO71_05010 [Caldimonas sp.]